MTREEIEEKMHEAAEEIKPLVTTLVDALCEAHQKGYLAGVELGVNIGHPHWIPVDERLPEIPKNDWKSDNVLFVVDGEIFYGYRCKYTWFAPFVPFDNHQVTHWMEIQPPRREE